MGKFVEYWRAQNRSRGVLEEVTKEGVFTGSYCVNPVTGWQMPIYVANFVLMEYGTGAVMAVPAHDQRDFEFAQKYDLPIKVVIQPPGEELKAADLTAAYEDEGVLVDSGQFTGMASAAAKEAIAAYLEEKGQGKPTVNFRLRDWLISRQRYWGAPIPIIYCDRCGLVPVPAKDLPVVLPLEVEITGEGGSPLAQLPSFYQVDLPHLRWPGPAGSGHHGHLRGVLLVFPALRLRRLHRRRPGPGPGELLGRRWTSTSAASNTRCCTCCTPAFSPRFCGTWGWWPSTSPFSAS